MKLMELVHTTLQQTIGLRSVFLAVRETTMICRRIFVVVGLLVQLAPVDAKYFLSPTVSASNNNDSTRERGSSSSNSDPFQDSIPAEEPTLSPLVDDEQYYKESIVYTTLAGNLAPFLKRLRPKQDELTKLLTFVSNKVHVEDMMLMALLGWSLVPLMRVVYNLTSGQVMLQLRGLSSSNQDESDEEDNTYAPRKDLPRTQTSTKSEKPFYSSRLFHITDHIQQLAKIALLVYVVDILKLFCVGMGFEVCEMNNFPHAFAQLAYTVWLAQRIAAGKKKLLRSYVSQRPDTYGRVQVTNRLLNASIIAGAGFVVLNILQFKMGVAVNSFLALGSISTLALTLASQGIFQQVLNGLMIASSDRIYEGDFIRFSNGLKGTIEKLGWMETIIRGPDEVMVSVPHTDLVKLHVSNLSRVRFSQVSQTLKFKYSDAEKIPELIQVIKNEIYSSCPSLITDGTRPFRVYWSDYAPDGLEVTVEAHFRIRILSEEYHENRQRVLLAIRRAVKNSGLTFLKE